MKIALTELNGLSEQDLEQIDQWLDEFSYRKTARLASQKFNRSIHRRTIERFANRAAPKDFLDDSPDAEQTAGQILQFAASGQTQFTEASVHVLEQTAFKLSFSCTHREEDMKALLQISTMLFRHRNASVRERTAKIQEQKIQLRREELQGRGILPARLASTNPVGDEVTSPTSTSANEGSTVASASSASASTATAAISVPEEDETDSTPDRVPQLALNATAESAPSAVQSPAPGGESARPACSSVRPRSEASEPSASGGAIDGRNTRTR
jgi:hypothetical protein